MKGADKSPRLFFFNSTARPDFAACRAEVAAILADHCIGTARRAFAAVHQGKAMRIDLASRDTLGYLLRVHRLQLPDAARHRRACAQARATVPGFLLHRESRGDNRICWIAYASAATSESCQRGLRCPSSRSTSPRRTCPRSHDTLRMSCSVRAAKPPRAASDSERIVAVIHCCDSSRCPVGNEELDGPLDRHVLAADPPRHLDERHREIKRLLARLRQILDLLDDRGQLAARPMIDRDAQRVEIELGVR